ncbi:PAS domain-containing protein [Paracoccus luteus]|uniref:PAS domain-containing protein n=1 Tax=Paracoccus luteus TaxID=2508543 RepID=UPI00106F1317|nr:PAS domain-containing protein [Paracoccus luteus]
MDDRNDLTDGPADPGRGAIGPAAVPPCGDRVLRLADFDPVRPARIVAEMRDYWQSLRVGRAIPGRADVEPRGLRRTLDFAFILERVAPGAARFRLAGRHLVDLMGMEVRGMPLCAFVAPSSRGRLSDVLETVFKGPQIVEMTLSADAGYGRPALAGRMLLLPLRSDLGDVTRALGCLVTEGEVGRAPRRFDLTAETLTPVIEGARVLDPSPSAAGFAEPPAPWRADAPPPKPQPGLIDQPVTTPQARRAAFRVITRGDD